MAELESQIIESWNGFDGDDDMIQFYDCVLKVQVGNHEPGTKIPLMCFNYSKSRLELYLDGNTKPEDYKLLLSVGERMIDDGSGNPDSGDEES